MTALKCENIFKTFKVKGKKVTALNGINLNVDKGKLYGFLGPNGAGKSTTIKVLMDLIKPDKGVASVFGSKVSNPETREMIGFLPENPVFMDNLTGREVVEFSGKSHGMKGSDLRARGSEVLDLLHISFAADRPVRKYSKGMVQRLGFAAAITHRPELLILDEPMSGLDPLGRVLFKDIMQSLHKSGTTILFSSHIIPDIEDICTDIGIIKNGVMHKEITGTSLKYSSTDNFKIVFKYAGDFADNLIGEDAEKINEDLAYIIVEKDNVAAAIEKIKSKGFELMDVMSIKKDLESLFVEIAD